MKLLNASMNRFGIGGPRLKVIGLPRGSIGGPSVLTVSRCESTERSRLFCGADIIIYEHVK